jgi:membrane protease YdiL (CAAX protease family)
VRQGRSSRHGRSPVAGWGGLGHTAGPFGPGAAGRYGGSLGSTEKVVPLKGSDVGFTGQVRRMVQRHPVISYVVLAYAFGWAWCVPMAVRGDTVRMGVGWPTQLPALVAPALAAIVVTGLTAGRAGLRELWARVIRWRIGWRGWALVVGTLSLVLVAVVGPLLTGSEVPALAAFTRYSGIGPITPLGVVAVAFVVNGLGEETGWRGFAVDRLLRAHSFTWTALVVGVVWAGWHLPFFWIVAGFRGMGLLAVGWAIGLVAGSVVLTWLYREGHRSILLVAAWHTSFNLASATEATGVIAGTVSSVLVIGCAVWILVRERTGRHRVFESAASRAPDHADVR